MAVEVFTPVAKTVEVVLKAERSGEQRRNVIHYKYTGDNPSASELQGLLNELEGGVIQEYEDFVSLGTRWYELTARDIDNEFGLQVARSINRLSAGPIDNMPGAVSFVLTKRTDLAGRRNRGRFYLIDLPEDFFNGDDLNIFYIPVINELATQLLASRGLGARFRPAVASKTYGTSEYITAITYDLVADTQRRRGKNRGQ